MEHFKKKSFAQSSILNVRQSSGYATDNPYHENPKAES